MKKNKRLVLFLFAVLVLLALDSNSSVLHFNDDLENASSDMSSFFPVYVDCYVPPGADFSRKGKCPRNKVAMAHDDNCDKMYDACNGRCSRFVSDHGCTVESNNDARRCYERCFGDYKACLHP